MGRKASSSRYFGLENVQGEMGEHHELIRTEVPRAPTSSDTCPISSPACNPGPNEMPWSWSRKTEMARHGGHASDFLTTTKLH